MNRLQSRRAIGWIAVGVLACLPRLMEGDARPLPPESGDLSLRAGADAIRSDVTSTGVRTCGCWSGPRGMAQKKFKFRIVNNSEYELNISGGTDSNIRLLVALPEGASPDVTLPTGNKYSMTGTSQTVPPNVPLVWTDVHDQYTPSRLQNGNRLFGVDPSWSIYLYPPTENRLVEDVQAGAVTFPTYVDETSLAPGEEFSDPDYGEGAWVFYVPMTQELFDELDEFHNVDPSPIAIDDDEFVVFSDGPGAVPREVIAKSINILGIAVVDPLDSSMIGFSPAPPDSTYTQADLF